MNYRALQDKQRDWLDKMELREIRGGWGRMDYYEVQCRTCKVSRPAHTTGTAKIILNEHQGHYTWIDFQGSAKVQSNGYIAR